MNTLNVNYKRELTTFGNIDKILFFIPIIILLFHAFFFRKWIIDDAGITFSYARNLAQGYGLVSQPGEIPVEGYSNFLWLLVHVPFFIVGIFHPIILPKLISVIFVVISFSILSQAILLLYKVDKFILIVILSIIALNTSFVVWTTSGLENPLYVFLLSLMFLYSLKSVYSKGIGLYSPIIQAVLTFATALTRPDGVMFSIIYPVVIIIRFVIKRDVSSKQVINSFFIYFVCSLCLFGGFILFRKFYFGELFPNTYYAKGGPKFDDVIQILTFHPSMISKLSELLKSVAGRFGNSLFLSTIILTIFLAVKRRLTIGYIVLLLFLVVATSNYLLLPKDWMREYRFATPFFVFFNIYCGIIFTAFIYGLNLSHLLKKGLLAMLIILSILGSGFIFYPRSKVFSKWPVAPFTVVADAYGHRFNKIASILVGHEKASFLVPDLGGTLYYSNLKIYDLAGLCDKTIAMTLRMNQKAFYNYVFETVRPTFIHTHGWWTLASAFNRDDRFRRDYVALYEYEDKWLSDKYNLKMVSGDYVRKEVFQKNPGGFEKVQKEYKKIEASKGRVY